MTQPEKSGGKPRIVVSDIDYKRLTGLAYGAESRVPEVAEKLLSELDRAHVVMAGTVATNVVQMGSILEFRLDSAQQRVATLVYPGEADVTENRISVLTPIGAAMIGLSTGQSITWTARDGRSHELTIVAVEQPAASRPHSSPL